MTAIDDTAQVSIPLLLGLSELADLLEGQVTRQSVYRWRVARQGSKPALPDPVRIVSGTPMWTEDVIVPWAEARGFKVTKKKLDAVRRTQR